jgi:hypothetical protein
MSVDIHFRTDGAGRVVFDAKIDEAGGIAKGKVVYISGASGANPLVKLADNTGHLTSHVIGIAGESGNLNDFIEVVRAGEIENIDTSTFSIIAPLLHLSTAGGMTSAHPTIGTPVPVAYTLRVNSEAGKIFVSIGQFTHDLGAASGQDLELRCGDTLGVNKISVRNYDHTELFHINSLGAFVDGSETVTVVAMSGAKNGQIAWTIDGSGSALTTGNKSAFVMMPYSGNITAAYLLADQAGDVVVDIWKDTYANFPPTVAATITAAAKPTLSSAIKYKDVTLSGWTKAFLTEDIYEINIDSVATITKLQVILKTEKTGA